jgi:hypothetical protein
VEGSSTGTIHNLLHARISWLKSSGQPKWKAMHNGQKCELVMNNFPEEPLYTLKCGNETLDLDDSPAGWIIPR